MTPSESNAITSTVPAIIIGLVILIVAFVSLARVDKYLRIKAVDDCGRISRYTRSIDSEHAQAAYPVVAVYQSCMKDKGY